MFLFYNLLIDYVGVLLVNLLGALAMMLEGVKDSAGAFAFSVVRKILGNFSTDIFFCLIPINLNFVVGCFSHIHSFIVSLLVQTFIQSFQVTKKHLLGGL